MLIRVTENSESLGSHEIASPACTAPVQPPSESCSSLLFGLNNEACYLRDICLHQLFETQVEKTPEAISLVFRQQQLTYRELNARANQVAHHLRQLGVGPEIMVGVYMERSLEMVIAIYGILKAGGAYVPLDPSYPHERVAFMLEDTKVPVVLTQAHLQSQLVKLAAERIICLDTEWERIAQESTANPASGVKEENLAYVMYTSGSTGRPKGVMIEHRGICNQLQWMRATYPLTAEGVTLLKTAFSFDVSLYEIFSTLIAGAKLVIAEPEGQKDSTYLTEIIQRERVTTLFMVPSLLHILMEDQAFPLCTSLKDIFCTGEPLTVALQQRFFARAPQSSLHNLYGPTEVSIECTHWDCERTPTRNIVPIGRPMANYQIYILDEQFKPVPVGQVGEIFIGGIGLARGYLNRPALTEEKFISMADCGLRIAESAKKPQSTIHNPKLYRTGDLGRWLPDGVIQCLGRIDFQVKIRGNRIELGEIETVLNSHPAVRESVVVAREDVPGDQRLVAYYLAEQPALPTTSELREQLKQKLPDYMVPSAFIQLESFPLSPNGKLDRRQLPAPEQARTEEFVAAANGIESELVRLWEQVLRVHPIGVTENFFDLGGHSLLAVRIFRAIEEQFGQRLPLAMLFQFPTIRQLARLLAEKDWQPSWSSLVPLQTEGTKPPFFCVHPVGGNVLEYYELARQLGTTQPFYGLQSVGLDGQQTPLQSIEAMAAHYIQEIRQFQPQGPYYLGGRSFGGVVAFEMAQQLRAQGQAVAFVALLDTDPPIGWLKLFPRRAALQLRARFLALRIQCHLRNLHGRSWAAKGQYIREKIAYKKRKIETWRWQLRRAVQRTPALSDALRNIEEFNYLAAEKYVPRRYPERVTFFCAAEEVGLVESAFGWQQLAADGLEIVRVPGDHQTMIQEPHVQVLAKQLMERLAHSPVA